MLVSKEAFHGPGFPYPRCCWENTFQQTFSECCQVIAQLQQSPAVKPLPLLWFLHTRSALPEAPGRWKYTAGQELQCCLQKWEWQTFANSLPGSTEELEKFRKSKTPRATEHKCSPFGSDANYWHLGGCLRKYHCMIIPILFPRYLLFTVSYNTLLFPSVPISLSYIESLVLNVHDSIHLTWVPFWHCNNQSPSSVSQFQAERFWDDCGEIKHSKIWNLSLILP